MSRLVARQGINLTSDLGPQSTEMRIGVSPKLELWVYASNQVVKCLDLSVDWQVIDLENTPEPTADGHSPLVAWLRNQSALMMGLEVRYQPPGKL
jgi:hypothetical protein